MLDCHSHLNDSQFDEDREQVISNLFSNGIDATICVGWDYKSSLDAREIAKNHLNVYYTVGYHPDNCAEYDEDKLRDLLDIKDDKLVAIGEIGLDYFHNRENKDEQKQVFISQILLAKTYHLPFVIHCREAFGDTLEILKKYAPFPDGVVMHCYSGSLESARELIKMGVKISFTGTVTYKNATNLQSVAKNIPLDSFFFETDCPYLAPVPHRGKRNEPKYVQDTARFVANLRGMDYSELIEITDKNAKSFFKI